MPPKTRPAPSRPAGKTQSRRQAAQKPSKSTKGKRTIHVNFAKADPDPDEVELADPPPVRPRYRPSVYESKPANPGGVFLPDHEQLVRLIAARGMSDDEIELIYGLGKGTLKGWKKHYPGLQRAIDEGRTIADSEVLFALYKTATGYNYVEDQAVGGRDPCVLQVTKHKAGEFAAQKHWLGNRIRKPDSSPEWPRSEQVELSTGKGGIVVETRNDLIESIIRLVTPKPDNERKRSNTEDSAKK